MGNPSSLPNHSEILRLFAEECDGRLSAMREGLRALERDPQDEAALETIFRAAHTIKGDSGTLGFGWLQDSTHVLETLLARIRNRSIEVSEEHVSLLIEAHGTLRAMVADALAGAPTPRDAHQQVLDRVAAAALAATNSGAC